MTDDEGSFAHPGSYYLASTTDDNIADGEDDIYRLLGRPPLSRRPLRGFMSVRAGTEGIRYGGFAPQTMDVGMVPPWGLQAYLTKNNGMGPESM